MKILIADDDRASHELMRKILEASGHLMVEGANRREALDLIRENQPELVF